MRASVVPINEEFSSTISRAQAFRDQTQNQQKEKNIRETAAIAQETRL